MSGDEPVPEPSGTCRAPGPLLTSTLHDDLLAARRAGARTLECSLDLGRSRTTVDLDEQAWAWQSSEFPYPEACRPRTVYYWAGDTFEPVARFATSLIKLVPTEWGPPTFEIDGIKMLPTARISPYEDAAHKVGLVRPAGKVILDTCAGLGYFAHWCLEGGAARVFSCEKNPDVLWMRSLNPWSPQACDRLSLTECDVTGRVEEMPTGSVDAILHDPPRFGIAGELYSLSFYAQLARVLKRGGRLFHYTGSPNRLSRGRDLAAEVARRLQQSGFTARQEGDGVLGARR